MSDAPFFPDPAGKAPKLGPYRAPEQATPSPSPSPRSIDIALAASISRDRNEDAVARAQLIEELVATRTRAKRNATLQIAFGVVLFTAGVVVTLVSEGAVVFYGAAAAGMVAIMRGAAALVQVGRRSS